MASRGYVYIYVTGALAIHGLEQAHGSQNVHHDDLGVGRIAILPKAGVSVTLLGEEELQRAMAYSRRGGGSTRIRSEQACKCSTGGDVGCRACRWGTVAGSLFVLLRKIAQV